MPKEKKITTLIETPEQKKLRESLDLSARGWILDGKKNPWTWSKGEAPYYEYLVKPLFMAEFIRNFRKPKQRPWSLTEAIQALSQAINTHLRSILEINALCNGDNPLSFILVVDEINPMFSCDSIHEKTKSDNHNYKELIKHYTTNGREKGKYAKKGYNLHYSASNLSISIPCFDKTRMVFKFHENLKEKKEFKTYIQYNHELCHHFFMASYFLVYHNLSHDQQESEHYLFRRNTKVIVETFLGMTPEPGEAWYEDPDDARARALFTLTSQLFNLKTAQVRQSMNLDPLQWDNIQNAEQRLAHVLYFVNRHVFGLFNKGLEKSNIIPTLRRDPTVESQNPEHSTSTFDVAKRQVKVDDPIVMLMILSMIEAYDGIVRGK